MRVDPDRFLFFNDPNGEGFEGEATLGWVRRWYENKIRESHEKSPEELEIGVMYKIQ